MAKGINQTEKVLSVYLKTEYHFYVQIYIYLHEIYTLGPQILRVHKSWVGWEWDESLSFRPDCRPHKVY